MNLGPHHESGRLEGVWGVGHVAMTASHLAILLKFECFLTACFEKYWKVSFSTYDGHRGGNVYSIVEKNLIMKKYPGKKIFLL